MKEIGLFYSFNTQKTARAAKLINEAFDNQLKEVNVEDLTSKQFLSFDNYILGVPTWFDGELPNYWDEFIPDLEELNLKGKTFALYENFVDGIGILAEYLEKGGAKLVGFTSSEGYDFESSKALRGEQFCGLPLDFENQGRQVKPRIKDWTDQLKKEFK